MDDEELLRRFRDAMATAEELIADARRLIANSHRIQNRIVEQYLRNLYPERFEAELDQE